ncbi:MAG: hypothetical protein WAN86_21370, partial [Hyphomicrobiaceae bacterium]
KASDELSTLLEKWFAKHLVTGISLPMLRVLHETGALSSFLECLAARDETDVIAILRRVDPHRSGILKRPRREIEAHIRDLATSQVAPALDVKGIVKGIKLPKLRALHDAGALSSFLEGLAGCDVADVIGVLRKVDPHKGDILNRPRPEMEAHIKDLATSRIEPAQRPRPPRKPRTPSKPKTPKQSSAKPARTGGVYERSRL